MNDKHEYVTPPGIPDQEISMNTELVAEGIDVGDGLFYIKSNDILVLKANGIMSSESLEQRQKEIQDRTGIRVALLDAHVDIVGVVESGT